MTGQHVEMNQPLRDFLHEVNLELERLAMSACVTEFEDKDSDVHGTKVSIGYLVVVVYSNHHYYEWVVMVNKISPFGTLLCMIRIPPLRYRQTIANDFNARRSRPRDKS